MSELLQFVRFKNVDNWDIKLLLSQGAIFNDNYNQAYFKEFTQKADIQKINIEDGKKYKILGVRSYGLGVYLNREVLGETLKMRVYQQAKENHLFWCKVDTKNGAFGIVDASFKNALGSSNMAFAELNANKINTQYLQLFFKSKIFNQYLDGFVVGTTNRKYIKFNDLLNNVKIPLPCLETQKQLVKSYQDKINFAKQQEQQAQQKEAEIESYLYKQLGIELLKEETQNTDILQFVQFKDLQEWGYAHNIEKFKFNSCHQMVDLNSVCGINRGGSPRPISEFITNNEDGINWIKIGDTKGIEKYIFETKEKIKPEGAKRSRTVKDGDFILSNSMSFGKPYIMKTTGCIHDGWLLLRLNKKLIGEDYLYSILSSEFMFKIFQESTSGAVVQNLNIEIVKNIKIPLPPLTIQNQIAEHIQGIKNKIKTLKQQAEQNQKLALSEFEAEIFNAS